MHIRAQDHAGNINYLISKPFTINHSNAGNDDRDVHESSDADPDEEHPPHRSYSDMTGHWAAEEILEATAKGIVNGYPDGTFKPDNPITRAEFTVMLIGALQPERSGTDLTFIDAAHIGKWAREAVAQAVQLGIIKGYEDHSFRPNQHITRAEMAVMIARAMHLPIADNDSTRFADDDEIPRWAKGAVEAIRKLDIVNGRGDNQFVPNDTATRAEATVMLLRMLRVMDHK